MSYVALYRKFRPPVWDDVKGQDHIVTTLRNQIRTGRIGHAYLFCGTRGTGKTSVAKILARAVNCGNLQGESPCGVCESCKSIAAENSLNVIEIDAASNNGVENVRTIVEEVQYPPPTGRYKVYIIDEVHMLSNSAFNALLKTLEEPPSYVLFLLATTEVQKLPVTILSRCQRYDFHRITADVIGARLREITQAEHLLVEDKAIDYIALAAEGSMRDSLSILDQCIAFRDGETLTYERTLKVLGAVDTEDYATLFNELKEGNAANVLRIIQQAVSGGCDPYVFVNDFVWFLRNLMLLKGVGASGDEKTLSELIDLSPEHMERLKETASRVPMDTVMRYIRIFSGLSGTLRYAAQKRVLMEMSFLRACYPQAEGEAADKSIEERLALLEARPVVQAHAQPQGTPQAAGTEEEETVEAKAAHPQEKKKPEKKGLIRAVPGEVRSVIDRWDYYVSMMSKPTKTFMTMHPRPKPSVSEDGHLVIALFNRMHADYMRQPEQRAELEAMLAEQTGRRVEVEIDVLEDEAAFEEKYPDLSTIIHEEIETEDESEEDF